MPIKGGGKGLTDKITSCKNISKNRFARSEKFIFIKLSARFSTWKSMSVVS